MMERKLGLAMLLCAAAAACSGDTGTQAAPAGPSLSVTPPACVEFGPPPAAGTVWGAAAGHVPGDAVHSENGIKVLVQTFYWFGGSTFGNATVDVPTYPFASGQAAGTNNINLQFSFSNLGWTPTKVYFSYLDEGGFENLSVNGSAFYIGELDAAPAVLGGRNVSVWEWAAWPSADQGFVQIDGGSIKSITVGGQEFWIDKLCAEP